VRPHESYIKMIAQFHKRYIQSSETDLDDRSRAVVLNWLLVGAMGLTLVTFFSSLSNVILNSGTYGLSRLFSIALFFGCLLGLYNLARDRRFRIIVALFLVGIFCIVGTAAVVAWGIFIPIGLLIMSLSIVMAGVLVSARASLYAAAYVVVALVSAEYARSTGAIRPNFSWMSIRPTFGDIVGFGAIFAVIALVSWLFNRQMEQSLERAQRSEAALKRQKAILEIKVRERTRELEKLQLEKMEQLYRFAELGRLSTSLFHDLANHLTTINIDLEGLGKTDQSKIMQRLQHNASYIDDVIRRVREQLLGKEESESFTIRREIDEIMKILQPKAKQAGVDVAFEYSDKDSNLVMSGSLTRFRQLIINLLSNAIDSYEDTPKNTKSVTITLHRDKQDIVFSIQDEGSGIAPEIQATIFTPFYSTKHGGVGIGLFIVKQITEQHFKGTIELVSSKGVGSTFTIKLPRFSE
jgi:signal transduction histidine kinase